ncbi:MAG: hypothetical protein K6L75_05145 [Cellvibrionaceae bacterium]
MENSYSPGHPWYYKLGGRVLNPAAIMEEVKQENYRSYMADDITKAGNMAEPKRSQKLRDIKTQHVEELAQDLEIYRKYVHQLRELRTVQGEVDSSDGCLDLYMSLSLKHNHIYNDMAVLLYADTLLCKPTAQMDLFG